MPFDSRPEVAVPVPAGVQAIDKVIKLLGPEGKYWAQDAYNKGRRYCIVGAMYRTGTVALALPLVSRAIAPPGTITIPLDVGVVAFNDTHGRTFADIRTVLLKARALAWEDSYAV